MNKKIIILVVLVLVVVIGAGIFWWDHQTYMKEFRAHIEELNKNMPEGLKYEKGADGVYRIVSDIKTGEPAGDFSLQDTLEGKMIENEKEGLKARVPEGWRAEIMEIDPYDANRGVELFSPDVKFTSNNIFLEQGCVVEVMVERNPLKFEVANTLIENINQAEGDHPLLEKDGFEIIEVDNKPALKELLFRREIGIGIEVRVPVESDKNIYFGLHSSPESEKTCMQEFDKFLNTVVID